MMLNIIELAPESFLSYLGYVVPSVSFSAAMVIPSKNIFRLTQSAKGISEWTGCLVSMNFQLMPPNERTEFPAMFYFDVWSSGGSNMPFQKPRQFHMTAPSQFLYGLDYLEVEWALMSGLGLDNSPLGD